MLITAPSYWYCPGFAELFAKRATKYCFDEDSDYLAPRFVFTTLPLFENLKELIVERKLTAEEVPALPRNLKKLLLNDFQRAADKFDTWFQFLSPTLEILSLKCGYLAAVRNLKNLKLLAVENFFSMNNMKECFECVKEMPSLRSLIISESYGESVLKMDLRQLTQLNSMVLREISLSSWDLLLQIIPKNLRVFTLWKPRLGAGQDCGQAAVQRITLKLQEMVPGLIVKIIEPKCTNRLNY